MATAAPASALEDVGVVGRRHCDARWLHDRGRDMALAWCWAPFAIAVVLVQRHPHALSVLLSGVLLLSLSHQPLTLALVYGDRSRFREHRKAFVAAPVVAVVAVVTGLWLSLALVAVVAAVWNAEHTLMQRYGITRMYGRKVGDAHGSLERPMLVAWLVLAVAGAAANPATPRYLTQVDVGEVNRRGIALLASVRPGAGMALVPIGIGAAVLTWRWLRAEGAAARRGAANPAKWSYLAATAVLLAVIGWDPPAGFAAYVGAHAIEYFVIAGAATARRAAGGEGGAVGRVVRSGVGPAGLVVLAAAAVVVPLTFVERHTSFVVATAAYLSVGALHIAYDGLIWKLRQPAVARDLAVAGAPAA